MRPRAASTPVWLAAALLLAAPGAWAQNVVKMPDLAVEEPAADGAPGDPSAGDLAAIVAAENAAARPEVDATTLADMQADLRAVSADLQALRAELLTSGAAGFVAAGGDAAIDRMNRMESQIATLTDRTEQLANRIRRIVTDGTNRIGDLEFRLCELDPNCDLGALMTAELGRSGAVPSQPGQGGETPSQPSDVSAIPLPPMEDPGPEAVPATEEETEELTRARKAYDEGQWQAAIEGLDHLISGHAGGPLTVDALYLRGLAQEAAGQPDLAAQSWIMAFGALPDGPRAPASLLALAKLTAKQGAPDEACPYLGEITRRFPSAPEAAEAAKAAQAAACSDEPLAEDAGAN